MSVYDKMDKATALVSVIAIQNAKKDIIGKIIFKFPRDGAGRLHVFIQEYGHCAIHGYAGGWGYDKRGAAIQDAFATQVKSRTDCDSELYKALEHITYDGEYSNVLRDAGYTLQVLC